VRGSIPIQAQIKKKSKKMNDIIEKVQKMRDLQKRYFKERSSLILQQCKAAERDVDQLLKQYSDQPATPQKTLF